MPTLTFLMMYIVAYLLASVCACTGVVESRRIDRCYTDSHRSLGKRKSETSCGGINAER